MTSGADKTSTYPVVYGILQFFVGSFGLDFIVTKAVFWIPVKKSRNNFAKKNYRWPISVIYKTGHDHDCFFPFPIFPVLILVSYSVVCTVSSLYIHRNIQRTKLEVEIEVASRKSAIQK
jgi:hypothetical protein